MANLENVTGSAIVGKNESVADATKRAWTDYSDQIKQNKGASNEKPVTRAPESMSASVIREPNETLPQAKKRAFDEFAKLYPNYVPEEG